MTETKQPVTVTDKAAREIGRIAAEQSDAKLYLRVRVVGGGCSGFMHKLDLTPDYLPEKDTRFTTPNGVEVLVDNRSMLYAEGAVVDFSDDLNRRGFIVSNVRAKSVCGCNSSFSM